MGGLQGAAHLLLGDTINVLPLTAHTLTPPFEKEYPLFHQV